MGIMGHFTSIFAPKLITLFSICYVGIPSISKTDCCADRSIQQIDVSFSCVCPVIDHKFRYHIVKVAVDPRGDSRVDPKTTLTM